MIRTVELNDKDIAVIRALLSLCNQPAVIKKADYFNKTNNTFGNICCDFHDLIFEKLGLALVKKNMLSEENKQILQKAIEEQAHNLKPKTN